MQLRVSPAKDGAKPGAGIHYLSVEELRGDSDATELDEWLAEQGYGCLGPGIWGIGDFGGLLSITSAEDSQTASDADKLESSSDEEPKVPAVQTAVNANAEMLAIQAELANMRAELAAAQAALEKRPNAATTASAALVPTPATTALPPDLVPTSPELLALAERGHPRRGLNLITPAATPGEVTSVDNVKSSASKAKLTVTEHLASAMLLNGQQQRIIKATRSLTLKGALGKVISIVTSLVMLGSRVTVKHWAIAAAALHSAPMPSSAYASAAARVAATCARNCQGPTAYCIVASCVSWS